MTDQPLTPIYGNRRRSNRSSARVSQPVFEGDRPAEKNRRFLASLDKPFLTIVGLLLVTGTMMVFSTTFDWAGRTFFEDHIRNLVLGLGAMTFFAFIDYRFWKRFSIWLLLVTVGALVAVLFFGDDTFGARRSLVGGRFQPGELAEFTIVVYMAAWLGSKRTKIQSIPFGLIPFGVLVGIIAGLVALQPDLSSSAVIILTAGVMYFLAGARIVHLAIIALIVALGGILFVQSRSYAQGRVQDFAQALSDPTQASYHTQQAIIAFLNGGWFGRGLGQSAQKIQNLPAPHTDSVFAVIGEELGVVGASVVILLFIAFAFRGFQIARRSVDAFGALLATGFTIWVLIQALLNIAVMTAVVPSTGVPLPFVSFGGSSLTVLMIGVGLMLSVQRIASLRQNSSERRNRRANHDRGWGNRRTRLSRTRHRGSYRQAR